MADWQRLGQHVVARRLALGYKTRIQLAQASGISARILGDIETGRRGRFDPKTLAALENTLGWNTGTANRVADGGEPTLAGGRAATQERAYTGTPVIHNEGDDPALVKVMRSDLSDDKKRKLVRLLIAEREDAEKQRVARAEDLIRLVADEE